MPGGPAIKTLAFDVDLGRIHGWSSVFGRVCYQSDAFPWTEIAEHDRILIEVASPRINGKTPAERFQRMRWALWNTMKTTEFAHTLRRYRDIELLVAPSDQWTLGYPEAIRHEMAQVTAPNHDLRECQAMIFFHAKNPSKWVGFHHYFDAIVASTKKAVA
jgi:hypothetical protein